MGVLVSVSGDKMVWGTARRRTEAGAAAVIAPEALVAEGRR